MMGVIANWGEDISKSQMMMASQNAKVKTRTSYLLIACHTLCLECSSESQYTCTDCIVDALVTFIDPITCDCVDHYYFDEDFDDCEGINNQQSTIKNTKLSFSFQLLVIELIFQNAIPIVKDVMGLQDTSVMNATPFQELNLMQKLVFAMQKTRIMSQIQTNAHVN